MTSIPPPSAPPPDRSEDRPMTFVEATLWTIGSVVLLSSLARIVGRAAPALGSDEGVLSLCKVAAYVVLLLLLRFFYFPATRPGLILATRPGSWVYYPIAVVLGAALLFPAAALYEAVLQRWPDQEQGSQIMKGFFDLPRYRQVFTGVGLVVAAPLTEEALFRGALFGTLRRHHHVVLVVLSTSTLFALVHLQPQIFLPIGMVGAILAYLRVASGSIWPGVLAHAAFNGLSFYLQVAFPDQADEPTPRWPVIGGAVLTAGLLALTRHLREKRGDPEPDLTREQEKEES